MATYMDGGTLIYLTTVGSSTTFHALLTVSVNVDCEINHDAKGSIREIFIVGFVVVLLMDYCNGNGIFNSSKRYIVPMVNTHLITKRDCIG